MTEIFREANEILEKNVKHFFPNARQEGAGYRLGDVHGNPGDSLHISNGLFNDFASEEAGDLVELYGITRGIDPMAAAKEITGREPKPLKQAPLTPRYKPASDKPPIADDWPQEPTPILAGQLYSQRPADQLDIYRDVNGAPLYGIARWDRRNGKVIRPLYYSAGGQWISKLPALEKRSLLHLEIIAKTTGPVLIVEGEKCVRAAREIGLNATTWAGGTAVAGKIDVTPLAGRTVKLWPDDDEPGIKAMKAIAKKLLAVGCNVLMVEAPRKDSSWDIADSLANGKETTLWRLSKAIPVTAKDLEGNLDLGEADGADKGQPAPLYNLSDAGNAERLKARHGDKLRWNFDKKRWLAWDGTSWQDDTRGKIQQLALEAIRSIPGEADEEDEKFRRQLEKFALKSESGGKLDALEKIARTLEGMTVEAKDLDTRLDEIATPTGTVDLKTGELKPNDPGALHTRLTKVGYMPMDSPLKQAPRFHKFLADTFGTEELAEWVQEYLGYSITGRTTAHTFAVFYGNGANGKSALLDIVSRVTGDYFQSARPETMIHIERRADTRQDLAALRGARLVVAQESGAGRALDTATIKAISSGDPITCRHLYGSDFTYDPTFKFTLVTNHKPRIEAIDGGIIRRLKLVPFNHTVPASRQDPTLAETIAKEEGEAVLAWLVEGARRFYANGQRLTTCQQIEDETREYLKEEDATGEWLEAYTKKTPGISETLPDLYTSFVKFCKASGLKIPDKRDLSRRLRDEGFDSQRERIADGSRVRVFKGIVLLTKPKDDLDTGPDWTG